MNIGIVGGDARTAYLAKMLIKSGKEVFVFGMENCEQLKRTLF